MEVVEHYPSAAAGMRNLYFAVQTPKSAPTWPFCLCSLKVQKERSHSSASARSMSLPSQPPIPSDMRNAVVRVIPGIPAHLQARKI